MHDAVTPYLPSNGPRKFSNHTHQAIIRGVKYIVESVDHDYPSSLIIIWGYNKALDVMWAVYSTEGESVRGLLDCNSLMYISNGTGEHGGVWVNNVYYDMMGWLEVGVNDVMIKNLIDLFRIVEE